MDEHDSTQGEPQRRERYGSDLRGPRRVWFGRTRGRPGEVGERLVSADSAHGERHLGTDAAVPGVGTTYAPEGILSVHLVKGQGV
jgi:hypothetical protein